MAKKNDALFPFRLGSETHAALERIAAAKNTKAQELLRRAAYAIVDYATVNGDKAVPLDMEIAPVNAPSETHLKVLEKLEHYLDSQEKKKK